MLGKFYVNIKLRHIKGKTFMKKTTIAVALSAVIGTSIITTACTINNHAENTSTVTNPDQLVECYGVGKTDAPILMTKGMCDQLPSTKQNPVNTSDYIQCYGVAAAGKNDCATSTVSCGGKVKTDRAPDAWVSLPKGICLNLKGGMITPPAK